MMRYWVSLVASIMVPSFVVVPIAGVMVEAENMAARTTFFLTGDLEPAVDDACLMPPEGERDSSQDQWISDDCFIAMIGAGLACVIAAKFTWGIACAAAVYFALAYCTCLSAWGLIQFVLECFLPYGGPDIPCMIDKCTLIFDDGSECEEYCPVH